MNRDIVFTTCAVVAGIAVVFSLPLDWLGTAAEIGAACAGISAVIVRIDTKTKPSASATAGALLLLNLPEQPLAKVKKGWALTSLFASATFLISLALSVIVRASI